MKKCPFCAEEIQDDAIKCKHCGEFLDGRARQPAAVMAGAIPLGYVGFEYKSKLNILGLPLIHIAQGIDPQTMRPRVAKGVIAIGNVAVGVLAIGGVALGALSIGGCSIGAIGALGGLAIGSYAVGGCAVGYTLAVGGCAISANIALGGLAIGKHVVGGTGADPEALKWLEKWIPGISKAFPRR